MERLRPTFYRATDCLPEPRERQIGKVRTVALGALLESAEHAVPFSHRRAEAERRSGASSPCLKAGVSAPHLKMSIKWRHAHDTSDAGARCGADARLRR